MLLKLLMAPITLPLAGFQFVMGRVAEMAERELYDEERIREELLLLQLRLDEGEVTEDEYLVEETDIISRLRAAREYRRQQALDEAGD